MLETLQSVVTAVGAHYKLLLSPCAMVHQSLPSYENLSSNMQRKPFLHANAPQIGCLLVLIFIENLASSCNILLILESL